MQTTISNASEAGQAHQDLLVAAEILLLLNEVEAKAATLHWNADVPDTQDIREILAADILDQNRAVSAWEGDIATPRGDAA